MSFVLRLMRRRRHHEETECVPANGTGVPSKPHPSYDVFVSHRGPDAKGTWADGIPKLLGHRSVFVDKASLKNGGKAWDDIRHALEAANIVVVVMSPRYQESAYCMEELRLAMERTRKESCVRMVFVDHRPGKVNKDLLKRAAKEYRRERLGTDKDILTKWNKAIIEAGGTSGIVYISDKDSYDDRLRELIGIIEEGLPPRLHVNSPNTHFVGRDQLVTEVMTSLDRLQRNAAPVRVVGLVGMGGVGKTTIAEKLRERFTERERFTTSQVLWLPGCRDKKAEDLQVDILRHFVNKDVTRPHTLGDGRAIIARNLKHKCVLLVLDDVAYDTVEQVLGLEEIQLGSGSVVVLTSRAKKAVQLDVGHAGGLMYTVSPLDRHSAHQLFREFAKDIPADVDEGLVSKAVDVCQGLPLSLKVLGTYLNHKDCNLWQDAINEVRNGQDFEDTQIFQVLRISCNGCSPNAQRLFLDIACLLLGRSKAFAESAWSNRQPHISCRPGGFHTSLSQLLDAHLVDFGGEKRYEFGKDVETLSMHDHLRDLGRGMTQRNTTNNVQILRGWDAHSIKQIELVAEGEDLRFTQVFTREGHLEGFTTNGNNKVRQYISFDFRNQTQLPNNFMKRCQDMTKVDLTGCSSLTFLPDAIAHLANLQTLDLAGCSSLTSLPDAIGHLANLQTLVLAGCSRLTALPDAIRKLANLQTLDLSECSSLTSLPDAIGHLANLQTLDLWTCSSLTSLPDAIGQLPNLQSLDMAACSSLTSLPDDIGQLAHLQSLDLAGCSSLTCLPDNIGKLTHLQTLDLRTCRSLTALPDAIGQLANLQTLDLSWCRSLTSLPNAIGQLTHLQTLGLYGCSSLTSLPEAIGQLANLQTLDLRRCSSLTSLPDAIGQLANLQSLDLTGCSSLTSLPDAIGQLANLQTLDLSRCSSLTSLPDAIGQLANLQTLDLTGCSSLTSLPDAIGQLANLQSLDLTGCSSLTSLPDAVGQLAHLQTLDLSEFSKLSSLPDAIGHLANLQTLDLRTCRSLTALPDAIGQLAHLQNLKPPHAIT